MECFGHLEDVLWHFVPAINMFHKNERALPVSNYGDLFCWNVTPNFSGQMNRISSRSPVSGRLR